MACLGPAGATRLPHRRSLCPALPQCFRVRLPSLACMPSADRKGSPVGEPLDQAGSQEQRGRLSWPSFLSALFVSGAISGTLLDGIHSRTGLQVYEMFALDTGGLHTSLAVPPLLGAFYLVLGSLYGLLDDRLPSPETQQAQERALSLPYVALAVGVLAADLQLSAYLYAQGTDFAQISLALALASAVTWKVFDGTVQGLGLAAFCALGAPLSELVLLQLVPLWSYPRADLDFGPLGTFVSWVPWCYFFYSPVLGAWARYLWQTCRKQ